MDQQPQQQQINQQQQGYFSISRDTQYSLESNDKIGDFMSPRQITEQNIKDFILQIRSAEDTQFLHNKRESRITEAVEIVIKNFCSTVSEYLEKVSPQDLFKDDKIIASIFFVYPLIKSFAKFAPDQDLQKFFIEQNETTKAKAFDICKSKILTLTDFFISLFKAEDLKTFNEAVTKIKEYLNKQGFYSSIFILEKTFGLKEKERETGKKTYFYDGLFSPNILSVPLAINTQKGFAFLNSLVAKDNFNNKRIMLNFLFGNFFPFSGYKEFSQTFAKAEIEEVLQNDLFKTKSLLMNLMLRNALSFKDPNTLIIENYNPQDLERLFFQFSNLVEKNPQLQKFGGFQQNAVAEGMLKFLRYLLDKKVATKSNDNKIKTKADLINFVKNQYKHLLDEKKVLPNFNLDFLNGCIKHETQEFQDLLKIGNSPQKNSYINFSILWGLVLALRDNMPQIFEQEKMEKGPETLCQKSVLEIYKMNSLQQLLVNLQEVQNPPEKSLEGKTQIDQMQTINNYRALFASRQQFKLMNILLFQNFNQIFNQKFLEAFGLGQKDLQLLMTIIFLCPFIWQNINPIEIPRFGENQNFQIKFSEDPFNKSWILRQDKKDPKKYFATSYEAYCQGKDQVKVVFEGIMTTVFDQNLKAEVETFQITKKLETKDQIQNAINTSQSYFGQIVSKGNSFVTSDNLPNFEKILEIIKNVFNQMDYPSKPSKLNLIQKALYKSDTNYESQGQQFPSNEFFQQQQSQSNESSQQQQSNSMTAMQNNSNNLDQQQMFNDFLQFQEFQQFQKQQQQQMNQQQQQSQIQQQQQQNSISQQQNLNNFSPEDAEKKMQQLQKEIEALKNQKNSLNKTNLDNNKDQ